MHRTRQIMFGDDPHGIEDLEIIASGGGFTVGVSFDARPEQRAATMAAPTASRLGLESLDYTLRTYVAPHSANRAARDPRLSAAIEITEAAKSLVKTEARRIYGTHKKAGHLGFFAAANALIRLPITFRAATLTIRNGFHFESALLTRLALEQLAWSYVVRGIPSDTLFDVEPQKCIKKLKTLLPAAGALYGELSRSSHITPLATLRYIKFRDEAPSVLLASFEQAWDDSLNLLALADCYCVVCEYVMRDYYEQFRHIRITAEGKVSRLAGRPGAELLRSWDDHQPPEAPP